MAAGGTDPGVCWKRERGGAVAADPGVLVKACIPTGAARAGGLVKAAVPVLVVVAERGGGTV